MVDIPDDTKRRIAHKMAELTRAYFDLMDEFDDLIGYHLPKEDGPEESDLRGPQRRMWLERVNPRRKLEIVTDPLVAYNAAKADDEEQEATHTSWAGGGGSSDFAEAMAVPWRDGQWATTEEDDGDE